MLDFQIKDIRMSISSDVEKQIDIRFEGGVFVIDLLSEELLSDYVDLDFVNLLVKDMVARKKMEIHPLTPILISYQGEPLAEIHQDGTKKLFAASSAKLGLKLLVHNMIKSL